MSKPSVFDNGGIIGQTLSFDSTDSYITGTTITEIPGGDAVFVYTPGTYSWTAPSGVTSVSVVCVGGGGGGGPSGVDASSGGGGGGLGWKNNIAVVPGQSYTVVVGAGGSISGSGGTSYFINTSTVAGYGGGAGTSGSASGGSGGGYVGTGGGYGGAGGSSTTLDSTNSQSEAGAGGGAGGYTGNGGMGAGSNRYYYGYDGAGGGGGGGGSPDSGAPGSGGGVGLYGQGANGAGGTYVYNGGFGSPTGLACGGGGRGADATTSSAGGYGGVRIVWGNNVAFPTTNVGSGEQSPIQTITNTYGNKKNSGIWNLASSFARRLYDAPAISGLYVFTTATFTPGTKAGYDGPSLTEARGGLSGAEVDTWKNNTQFFNTSSGIQLWTVPKDGTYTIEVWGAQGGDQGNLARGGKGARMRGDFALTEGEVINILVGQKGNPIKSGGGGGTYVYRNITDTYPLIVAGGGGGWGASSNACSGATTATSGLQGYGGGSAGGANGSGGNATIDSGWGGAGSGWLSNGVSGGAYGGIAYAPRNGAYGGNVFACGGGYGGFGGGGGGGCDGGGGGGGYSGGGSGGGGAGSYNSGTNQSNSSDVQVGDGKVTITLL